MMAFSQEREPRRGQLVRVKPTHPGVKVQRGEGQYGRFVSDDGDVLAFDEFIHARWLEGSVSIEEVQQ
jgi:hypothetical protein